MCKVTNNMFYSIFEKLQQVVRQVNDQTAARIPNNPSGGVPNSTGTDYSLTGAAAKIVFGQTNLELKFTAPATGNYLVAFTVGISSTAAADQIIVQLYQGSTPVTGIGYSGLILVADVPQIVNAFGGVALTANAEYILKAHNATAARGAVSIAGGNAKLTYVQLT